LGVNSGGIDGAGINGPGGGLPRGGKGFRLALIYPKGILERGRICRKNGRV